MGRGYRRGKAVRDYENQKLWEKFLDEFNARLEARAKWREEKEQTAKTEKPVAVEIKEDKRGAKENFSKKIKNIWRILGKFLHIFK